MTDSRATTFRQRLHDGHHLLGTFVKTPSPHATEMLGRLGFDFVILDAEHAPLDRVTIDTMVLAAMATGLPALVRVGDASASGILSALDCGAVGVLVPHVDSAASAREMVAACHYRGGKRGYSGAVRAGGYGTLGMTRQIAAADEQVTCIAMIEDVAALDHIEEIAATPGLDGFFIGRGDLVTAMGLENAAHPAVQATVERIAAAAKAAGIPLMVLPSSQTDAAAMKRLGATAFVLSSDQGFLMRAARQALDDYKVLPDVA